MNHSHMSAPSELRGKVLQQLFNIIDIPHSKPFALDPYADAIIDAFIASLPKYAQSTVPYNEAIYDRVMRDVRELLQSAKSISKEKK